MFRISRSIVNLLCSRGWGYWLFTAAIALSVGHLWLSTDRLINVQGWSLLGKFLWAAWHPELEWAFLQTVWQAALTTFAYAVCGTFLSLSLGFVGGLLSAAVVWRSLLPLSHGLVWQSWRALLAIPRSIHEVVWGLLLINIWGLDPVVALGAIAIPFGAIVAKIFAEILDDTPRQGFDALIYAGVPPAQALLYGLMPQALFNLVSYSFYRFECSLRSTAVLGMIGAGGLGSEIYLSLQSLRYEELWTLFYALIALTAGVDRLSGFLREKLGCTGRLDLNRHQFKVGFQRRNWLVGTLIGEIALVIWGFWQIQPDYQRLWSHRFGDFTAEFVQQLQRFTVTPPMLGDLFWLSVQTLEMSIVAIALAGTGGFIFAFCAAKMPRQQAPNLLQQIISPLLRGVSQLCLLICRGIPAPIWALVILFITFPGIIPGAIALGVHNLGILGRLMTEVIENLDPKPINALTQLGSSPNITFLYGTLPLTLPNFVGYSFYRWEVCLRETVIVGLVGAGGLGRVLTEQLSSFDYAGLTLTLLFFLGLTYGVDSFSRLLRQQLNE
jgi:phosphonate transport system permease protein